MASSTAAGSGSRAAAGEALESRDDPRAAFSGASGLRRNLRWDPLDSAYFAGYAMWNYLTTPLLLTVDGVRVREGEPWPAGAEQWRRLEVDFPDRLDTHSRHQTFYVDSVGLVRRHDYTAEVVGGWARAAHMLADHREVGGLVVPHPPLGPAPRPAEPGAARSDPGLDRGRRDPGRNGVASPLVAQPVLWHIEISHFNEKARWALDYKGVEHERRAPTPGAHMLVALWLTRGHNKTFPLLQLDGAGDRRLDRNHRGAGAPLPRAAAVSRGPG